MPHALPLVTGLAALSLLAAGCTHWPPPGQGGMAEFGPQFPAAAAAAEAGEPVPARLTCALDHLAQLRQTAAQHGRLGGRVALVELTAARAQREYVGGLKVDAERTLDRLGSELAELRTILATGSTRDPTLPLRTECT
jgi:hypothetical protein